MNVLIIDDEKHISESIQRLLEMEGIFSDCAETAPEGRRLLLSRNYDALILDLKLPGMDGQQLLEWMRTEGLLTPVIMISAHGDIRDAVEALKTGARDYLVKPFDSAELILKLRDMVADRKRETLLEIGRRTVGEKTGLIGETPVMRTLREHISRISMTPSRVLITGESGTGKEVVAREIHERSSRSDEPFVAVNLGGIHETLIESELFGHEKGAFTGAASMKQGLFELAGKGTLFLDEIGDMPLPLQVKLLRVLQEYKFRRLGGTRHIPLEARIITATNKDIDHMVEKGSFREDLFYRLNVVRIHVPPVRERKEDIPLLAGYLLETLAKKMGIHGIHLSTDAAQTLTEYDFPGNVRELENILERALIYRHGSEIGSDIIDIPTAGNRRPAGEKSGGGTKETPRAEEDEDRNTDSSRSVSMDEVERQAITRALKKWKGNRTRAAAELGISRRTIIYKIQKYGIPE